MQALVDAGCTTTMVRSNLVGDREESEVRRGKACESKSGGNPCGG